MYCIYSVWSCF